MGGPKPPQPQPPLPFPQPAPEGPGPDQKLRKRSGTKTVFTRPLGNAEQADISRKYLLGQ